VFRDYTCAVCVYTNISIYTLRKSVSSLLFLHLLGDALRQQNLLYETLPNKQNIQYIQKTLKLYLKIKRIFIF